MKVHAALVYLVVSSALAGNTYASIAANPAANHRKLSQAAAEISLATPAGLAAEESIAVRHRYPVNDEKGLLLTCIAPEMDTDSETDVFNNCTLAPGRTLDDVMHSFIRGIHEEQRQRLKEHAQSGAVHEQTATQKNAQ